VRIRYAQNLNQNNDTLHQSHLALHHNRLSPTYILQRQMKPKANFFEKVSAILLVAILMGIGMLIFHNILIHFGQ